MSFRTAVDHSAHIVLSHDDSSEDNSTTSSLDSLFDAPLSPVDHPVHGSHSCPPISGFIYDPFLALPEDVCNAASKFCMDQYFSAHGSNQVMLFDRAGSVSGLPLPLALLLQHVSEILEPTLPHSVHRLLFDATSPPRARQAILNFYYPGEGITPHIDLLQRFGDGIVGVSLTGNCVMDMERGNEKHGVFLPERSIMALTGEARFDWKHGIGQRVSDFVESTSKENRWVERGIRLSITFRWMLPGADIVGSQS